MADDEHTYDLDKILSIMKEAAMAAGNLIRQTMVQNDARSQITEKSSSTDLVTETDKECERIVMERLHQAFPHYKVIGEETHGETYHLSELPTFTIDPIDGTTNFVHRLPMTCVLIGFVVHHKPLVAVTYVPMMDELFYAIKGRGAFLDTPAELAKPIRVSQTTTDLTQAVVSMDCGYGRDRATVERYLSVQRALLERRIRNIRVVGCCGLTMAYVACGRLDAGFEEGSWADNTGPKIWDVTPGKLLVEEAGGVTRDITGRAFRSKELDLMQRSVFMAATDELADQLMDAIYSSDTDVKAV